MAKKKRTPKYTPAQIKRLRKNLGLSLTAAAAKVGVTRRAWAQYESGDRVPSTSLELLISLLADQKI